MAAANITGTVSLAQLPAAVVTNTETGVMLSNTTIDGALNLPSSVTVNSGGGLFLYSDAVYDFFAGPGAGSAAATANYGNDNQGNTGIGFEALYSDVAGYANTAVGDQALGYTTSGNYNAAFGSAAMENNSSGSGNTALGQNALANGETGNYNTAVGNQALYANPGGNYNTAIGTAALLQLGGFAYPGLGGTNNIALGYRAGYNLTKNESSNIYIGSLGVTGDNYIIRLGTPGVHTNTVIAWRHQWQRQRVDQSECRCSYWHPV